MDLCDQIVRRRALTLRRGSISFLLFTFLSLLIGSQFAVAVHPERARVSEKRMQLLLVKRVKPRLPADAVHLRGVVELQAQIDKDGNVKKLKVISGHPLAVPAVIDAVRQWKYKPFVINGYPVEVDTTIHVSFEGR